MNNGKKLSYEAFRQTLNELKGKENVSEIMFRDLWLKNINNMESLSVNGWYTPPPYGVAVLFAQDSDIKRINFKTLRDPVNSPSDNIIDWESGLLFAYSSFVDIKTGLLGDFDITLYFGKNIDIINHFKLCHRVTMEVIEISKSTNSSKILFEESEKVFLKYGLKNSIVSVSDLSRLDLGHSIPLISPFGIENRTLPDEYIEKIKNARKFICEHSDWALSEEEQFTIEPQLISIGNPELPQVCFHYLIKKNKDGTVTVMNENDELIKEYGLKY